MLSKVCQSSRGVCIQIKNGLSYEECKVLNEFSFNESCWCVLKLQSNKKMLIGGIYRSPSSNITNSRHLNDLINVALNLKYDFNMIVGDFELPNSFLEGVDHSEQSESPQILVHRMFTR